MLITTTPTVEGKKITAYHGIVGGEAVLGANIFRDFFAGIRDIVGGRSASYEKVLSDAKQTALDEMASKAQAMGANAIVSVDVDYESIGGSMLMVSATGTAVVLE
jgi:uncharacterized protein YbjQ (UPF0145 family)